MAFEMMLSYYRVSYYCYSPPDHYFHSAAALMLKYRALDPVISWCFLGFMRRNFSSMLETGDEVHADCCMDLILAEEQNAIYERKEICH